MQEATARIRYSVIQYEPTEPGRLRYLLKFSGESVIAMLTIIIIIIIITVMLPRMILHPAGECDRYVNHNNNNNDHRDAS